MSSYPYSLPTYVVCHACGDRHERDLRGEDLRDEVLALLAQLCDHPLDDESPLCLPCVSDARREHEAREAEEREAEAREAEAREAAEQEAAELGAAVAA